MGNKATKKSGAGAAAVGAGESKAADKKDSGEWLRARHADRKSNVKTVFDAIDADKSGDIVKEEMARFAARIKQDDALNKLMAMADSNTDGRVTLDEFTQFLQNLLLSAFAKVDTNGNKVIDTNELAVLFAIMAHDKSKDDTPELMQLLKVRIENELGAGAGADGEDRKTDFDRFVDFSLDLLAASVLCALKDDTKELPLPVRNLLNFSIEADEWEKLTGRSLADAIAADKKDREEKDMQQRIKEAMEAALKAEAERKAREAKEAKDAKDAAKAAKDAPKSTKLSKKQLRKQELDRLQEMARRLDEFAGAEKPVVYAYSAVPTDIKVSCEFDSRVKWGTLTSYPRLETASFPKQWSGDKSVHSWHVRTAGGSGSALTERKTGRTFPYLFYEATGAGMLSLNQEECVCVAKADLEAFLRAELRQRGLVGKEIDDFCVYWMPRLQAHDFVLMRDATEEFCNRVALTVTPTPELALRVFFVWRGVSAAFAAAVPALAHVRAERSVGRDDEQVGSLARSTSALTVVEWGGAEL